MNIIVCCKQVLDPEAPVSTFKVDPSQNKVLAPPGVPPVINPFDEYAVEAALRIKDKTGAKITIISMGNNLARDVVKKPLAVGADELILLDDPAFDGADSWSTANTLAAAIRKIGQYDLILCGREAADWDAGQVGIGIAEILGIPCITVVRKIEIAAGNALLEKVVSEGYETLEVSLPALVTVSNELGERRYATIKGVMAAAKKQPTVWKPADIGVDPGQTGAAGRRMKLLSLVQPSRQVKCEIVGGETPADVGANLALKLREAKLI